MLSQRSQSLEPSTYEQQQKLNNRVSHHGKEIIQKKQAPPPQGPTTGAVLSSLPGTAASYGT